MISQVSIRMFPYDISIPIQYWAYFLGHPVQNITVSHKKYRYKIRTYLVLQKHGELSTTSNDPIYFQCITVGFAFY